MNPNLKKDFEEQFRATVEPGTRKFRRAMRVADYGSIEQDFKVEDIPTITIHMTEEEFEHMTQYIPGRVIRERTLREDIPALQKAWDHYQVLLKMCGGGYI